MPPFEAVRADGSLTSGAELQALPGGGAWAGDLTVAGMRDSQALGERLRQRYIHLLQQPEPEQDSLEVRSTPLRRTIETAMGVLSTLLPQPENETIRLNADDIGKDWMLGELASPYNAPELLRNYREGVAAHAASDYAERTRQLCAEAEELTGWVLPAREGNWLAGISPACDELKCRLSHGLWVGQQAPAQARDLDPFSTRFRPIFNAI